MSEIANDPTQAGVAVPEKGGARLTLPEIQSLCFKAARGAGMEWGLAEEAAFAARWLAAAGLPGPERLGARLQAGGDAAPETGSGVWRDRAGGALCPIAAGAALSDRAGTVAPELRLERLAWPVLILPFLSLVSEGCGTSVALSWPGGRVTVGPDGPGTGADLEALAGLAEATVEIAGAAGATSVARQSGRWLSHDDWAILDGFALRTTVPASEKSRAGAGAGNLDND